MLTEGVALIAQVAYRPHRVVRPLRQRSALTLYAGTPASTTHCSVGSLFGIAAVGGCAKWKTIAGILVVWVITLPLAAVLAGGVYVMVR